MFVVYPEKEEDSYEIKKVWVQKKNGSELGFRLAEKVFCRDEVLTSLSCSRGQGERGPCSGGGYGTKMLGDPESQ
jgi:hypothetical protein